MGDAGGKTCYNRNDYRMDAAVKRGKHMNGPMNRKKHVAGQASDSSMQTHGEGKQTGPVGAKDGQAGRKRPAQTVQNILHNAARPLNNRPGQQSGQGSGTGTSAHPQGTQRPAGSGVRPTIPVHRPQQSQGSQQSSTTPTFTTRPQTQGTTGSSTTRSGGGMGKIILILLAVLVLGGGGGLSGLFGGGDSGTTSNQTNANTGYTANTATQNSGSLVNSLLGGSTTGGSSAVSSLLSGYGADALSSLLGGSWFSGQTGIGASASTAPAAVSYANYGSTGKTTLDRTVASGSRAKYTKVLGNSRDTFTIMVYMCGADLESRSAMGTKDLQEMLNATFGSNVRLIVYTGGSTRWQNNLVSSSVNQIWQIEGGKMKCLSENAGTASMTNPDTLVSFIQFCKKNFSANRYALILWDHGSGSVSGYGYDEKNQRSGSMSLAGLNSAFEKGGVQFDFIGFDACLMATVENALMASRYADYLIASEETEPGIGWYYTDWLTALGSNTSISTLDLGKQICDDFVSHCSTTCRGQQTTLSLIDLAELSNTVPEKLTAFSKSVSSLITNKEYKTVSNARNGSREFAASSRIDQVDLIDLCNNLGTAESAALAQALEGAVKYNHINNISNAYGLSVYFPYQRVSNVDKAVSTYAAIGMDDSYAEAIRAFASVEAGGQAVSGGMGSPIGSLFGLGGGASSDSADMIGQLLSGFLGGGFSSVSGLDSGNTGFLSGRAVTAEELAGYYTENHLDSKSLVFRQDGDSWVLDLAPEQWALVHGVDLNVFYDNGAGYVDLGLDNLFEFDEGGRLVADTSGTWIAINGQPVPYYHETSEYASETLWRISGYVPALLNGVRVNLMLIFDQDHESGYVAGARPVYTQGETETVAKTLTEIVDGDTLVFLCDLYDYQQNYQDSYEFGNPVTVQGALTVSDVYLPDASRVYATYRITDIYNQAYWTPVIGK